MRFFYLKINRRERYTFRNLQHWIDIVEGIEGSDYCILCDNDILKQEVLEQIRFARESVNFLESEKTLPELNDIVTNITDERWKNAGYAHMTTFYHARKNHYSTFWNIDADDTCICLPPKRVEELFHTVEAYVEKNSIDIISLDMWTTRTKGTHWSFGVTYVNNSVDWFSRIKQHYKNEELKAQQVRNVDGYFSCLKICTDLRIETFYFENMRFIHYADDFIKRPDVSGFFIWKDGKLILPILLYCFGMEKIGLLPIDESIIKLDIGITDEESRDFLLGYILPNERKLLEIR